MKPSDEAPPRRIMTAAEVAEYLRIHLATLYRLVRKRQIPAFKIGTEIRFDRDVIEKWMIDRQVKR
jgi:excisionase family DNA binding protein